jgi:hypothetical protein
MPSVVAAIKYYQAQQADISKLFARLVTLAYFPHDEGARLSQPWLAADRMGQESLFNVQAEFTSILGDLAHVLGPGYEEQLLEKLPFLFQRT